MSLTAVLRVNMLTASLLLNVCFISGGLAACPEVSHLFITAPETMEALSGSCLQIPCTFKAKPERTFPNENSAVWIKNDYDFMSNPQNVIFNSTKAVTNAYPMSITGNLTDQNCTTLFSYLKPSYTDTYYFRLQDKSYKATAVCDPLQIKVLDSPPRPTITISGDLKEKESVTITCSAPTPCPHSPPRLTWNLQQDPHNIIEQNTDRTLATKIQKTITLSDQHDGSTITCSARYPVSGGQEKTAEETKTLNVSYAPKDTSVSIRLSGLVSAGSWVNLTCSSRANPPVHRFTWFKKSKDGAANVSEGPNYSFNVTDVTDVYYCVATNALGEQASSEIHLSNDGLFNGARQWKAVLGGVSGIILLVCLVVCVWFLVSRRRSQSADSAQQQNQHQTADEEEQIHYGEISFSNQRPPSSSASVQDRRHQEDSLYTQVKVSKAGGSEDVYAQVKKQ